MRLTLADRAQGLWCVILHIASAIVAKVAPHTKLSNQLIMAELIALCGKDGVMRRRERREAK